MTDDCHLNQISSDKNISLIQHCFINNQQKIVIMFYTIKLFIITNKTATQLRRFFSMTIGSMILHYPVAIFLWIKYITSC